MRTFSATSRHLDTREPVYRFMAPKKLFFIILLLKIIYHIFALSLFLLICIKSFILILKEIQEFDGDLSYKSC